MLVLDAKLHKKYKSNSIFMPIKSDEKVMKITLNRVYMSNIQYDMRKKIRTKIKK